MALAVGGCGDQSDTAETGPTGTTAPPIAPPTTTAPSTTSTAIAGRCSASGVQEPPTQAGLPSAVAATRDEIATAARACDYERLGELAAAGSSEFSFTFGAAQDPAEFWRQAEAEGQEPLRFLVELLARPYRAEPPTYVWPSAYSYPSWAEVPESDRRALRPLYGDEDMRHFEAFGSYVGYRIGISSEGEWLFFVAGD